MNVHPPPVHILFLSSPATSSHVIDLKPFLRGCHRNGYLHQTAVLPKLELAKRYNYLISYGFQKKITQQLIDYFEKRGRPIINLHRSFLPYNRNLYADLWSIMDGTPTGVTVHLVNREFDKGKILAQRKLELDDKLSYGQSEIIIHNEMKRLFRENWEKNIQEELKPFEQDESLATRHSLSDLPPLHLIMPKGKQTTREEIRKLSRLP